MGEKRNAYKILVGNPEGKRSQRKIIHYSVYNEQL
jgi:hypothetical protein